MTTASTLAAAVIVDELVRGGVREVVVAPGSRSAPLAMALYDADARGELRLHVRIDERGAAFLALGMAKASGRPAAVVTTSGTAVANLHPAVLEAHHAGVPLIAVTADRPAALRGTGANQTTDQVRIFGPAARLFADVAATGTTPRTVPSLRSAVARAVAAATGASSGDPGPVQLNVQFTEPLVPGPDDADPLADVPGRPGNRPWTQVAATAVEPVEATGSRRGGSGDAVLTLLAGPRTVVVAGDDAGPGARVLAEAGGWPLLAEPTSGARTGSAPVRTYRLLLGGHPLAARIERVVVFGHPTLSRPVARLLARPDVEVVVVSRGPTWVDAGFEAATVASAVRVDGRGDDGWAAAWRDADREVSSALDDLVAGEPGLTAFEVAAEVSAALPANGLLVVGSSNPVRDLDLMVAAPPVGEHRKIVANRGLAGIDGMVSTAVGAALGRDSSRALALMGDVTFLHDTTGLVIGPDEPRPALTVVVVNDDGGSIFATLEQGGPEHARSFERVFATPHHVDVGALCAATGTPHRRVTDLAGLRAALAEPMAGPPDAAAGVEVVEVVVDRGGRRALDQRIRALVRLS